MTQLLDADALHDLANQLVALEHVKPTVLREFALAYLALEEKLVGIRERGKTRGGKPSHPVTEDGLLVAQVLLKNRKASGKVYTLRDLARDYGVSPGQLSRCNSTTNYVTLPEPIRAKLRLFLNGGPDSAHKEAG